jgi:hypothetical protein
MGAFETDQQVVDAYNDFAATDYGRELASNVRFSRYNIGGLSNAAWTDMLGADVNNLTHMKLSFGCAGSYIRHFETAEPDTFSADDQIRVKLAQGIHDCGESIITDITYHDKTVDDEKEEENAFMTHLQLFFPHSSDEQLDFIADTALELVFNPESRLGTHHNLIERTNYLRTALRAAKEARQNRSPLIREGLRWLIADVLSGQPDFLVSRMHLAPPVRAQLVARQHEITRAFELPTAPDFRHYGDKAEQRREAFMLAKGAWQLKIPDAFL